MTRDQLTEALRNHDVPAGAVCFDGPGSGECYCIQAEAGGWVVYYSERGLRTSPAWYGSESQANQALFSLVRAATLL